MPLWVLELDVDSSAPWDTQIEALLPQLENHLPLLETLRDGSRDYTLHLSVQTPSPLPLRLPPRLCAIAATAGFDVELLVDSPSDDAH